MSKNAEVKQRQELLKVLEQAPVSTLYWLATYTQAAHCNPNPKAKFTTIIDWYGGGEIGTRKYWTGEVILNTPARLAQYVWRNMIVDKALNSRQSKVAEVKGPGRLIATLLGTDDWLAGAKLHPDYLTSEALQKFETLCLNGCGRLRKEASKTEYCSDKCRKNLSSWLSDQVSNYASWTEVDRHLLRKSKRFYKNLKSRFTA
jgi:hypothetical protein